MLKSFIFVVLDIGKAEKPLRFYFVRLLTDSMIKQSCKIFLEKYL